MGTLLQDGAFFGISTSCHDVAGVTLAEGRYLPWESIPPHAHLSPYLCVVLSGDFEELAGGRRDRCGPGTVVYHPPGEEHADRISRAGARCFNIQLGPALHARLEAEAVLPRQRTALPAGRAGALAVRLRRTPGADAELTALAIHDALLAILAELAGPDHHRGRPERRPRWLDPALDRLLAPDPPPVTELAADAGVHPVYFARAFRAAMGLGPSGFAVRTRLERASAALLATEASVSAIAHSAGFADHSHFCRQFRRTFGVTPSSYRAAFRS